MARGLLHLALSQPLRLHPRTFVRCLAREAPGKRRVERAPSLAEEFEKVAEEKAAEEKAAGRMAEQAVDSQTADKADDLKQELKSLEDEQGDH